MPTIALPADMTAERLLDRRKLQSLMNAKFDALQSRPLSDNAQARWAGWQNKAIDLLRTSDAQQAFAIEREPTAMRERYGHNRFGQSVLLARRLIEAGVSLVQVNWTRWETDDNSAPRLGHSQ